MVDVRYADRGDESRHTFFPLLDANGTPAALVGFHLFGTTDVLELPEAVLRRLACHALIQRLPDSALTDALDALTDAHDEYTARSNPPPALPEPPAQPIKARFVGERVETYPSVLDLD